MRTNTRVLLAAVCGFAFFGASTAVFALDGQQSPPNAKAPLPLFKNPKQAQQKGLDLFHAGDVASSLEALNFAADRGLSGAQWKLGHIYANGDGVGRDDLKAYQYFSRIVDNYDEDEPDQGNLAFVANAFVAVGVYSLTGIQNTSIKRDLNRALEMFQYAAMNFGEPNAQFQLARMYLDGVGVKKDSGQAVRWLSNAADKNHMESQALLGHLLFSGQAGLQRQRARGLMLLTMARDAASGSRKDAWVIDYYKAAIEQADENDRQMALKSLDSRLKRSIVAEQPR